MMYALFLLNDLKFGQSIESLEIIFENPLTGCCMQERLDIIYRTVEILGEQVRSFKIKAFNLSEYEMETITDVLASIPHIYLYSD